MTTDPFAGHRMNEETVSKLDKFGVHFVRVKGTRTDVARNTPPKGCIDKGWQKNKCRLTAALYHMNKGGLLGIVPASLNLLVFDVDIDDDLKEISNIPNEKEIVHPQALERANKLQRFLQKKPELVIPTKSGGIHFFYPCSDASLQGYNVPSSNWSVPGGESPHNDVSYGQYRYKNSQIILWYGGVALLEYLEQYRNQQDNMDADHNNFRYLNQAEVKSVRFLHGATKAGGRGKPLFGDITTDQQDTEESWIRRVEAIQFPAMGRHDYFLSVAGALVNHMAHSPRVKATLEKKFRQAIRNRRRRYDPSEVERMWKHAISTTKRALLEECRPRFQDIKELERYVQLRLYPQWRDRGVPDYIRAES